MSVHAWEELNREQLTDLLPRAVVVLSTGAVEQHGSHLATGTDSLLSQTLSRSAATEAAAAGAEVVLAPPLWFGASDHHLPFGGTISLRAETLLSVLIDLLGTMAGAGARKILIINGHGGNSGICHAAGAAVSSRQEVEVAHVDYWTLATGGPIGCPVPGHAGAFETSLMLATRPDLAADPPTRTDTPTTYPMALPVHSARLWRAIDGWTDQPGQATAAAGTAVTDVVVRALATAVAEWSRS